jgi:hypothetical protein
MLNKLDMTVVDLSDSSVTATVNAHLAERANDGWRLVAIDHVRSGFGVHRAEFIYHWAKAA